jgi:PAS domain-containing protein
MSLHALALELTIVFALWIALGASQQDPDRPGRYTFTALALAVLIWCAGELVEVRDLASAWTATRIKYLGIVTLPPFWLGFAAHVGRLDLARRVPWFSLVLALPGLMAWATMFSEPWSPLFVAPVVDGGVRHGPLWHVHVLYAWLLVAGGIAIHLITAVRDRHPGRKIRLAIGVASLLPFAANVSYLEHWLPFSQDPTPFLLGVTMLCLRPLVFRGWLLDVIPIAQRDLIDHLPLGVVLCDPHGVVIDLNPAAARGLGLGRGEALGRTVDALVAAAPGGTQVDTSVVELHGRPAARFVLLEFPKASRDRAAA